MNKFTPPLTSYVAFLLGKTQSYWTTSNKMGCFIFRKGESYWKII